jgi:hypothetical protein
MRRTALVTVLVFGFAVAPAAAKSDALTDRAWHLAQLHWSDRLPACGVPRFRLIPERRDHRLAEASIDECYIGISPGVWKYRYDQPTSYCTAVAHEWGHLLGYEHARRAGRTMSTVRPFAATCDWMETSQ